MEGIQVECHSIFILLQLVIFLNSILMGIKTKIGILGGGQLGKMLAQAAGNLSLDISFLDIAADFPAGKIWPRFQEGDFSNYNDVINFGKELDVISIEIETINTDALEYLESSGIKVYPQPNVIKTIKDKGLQKLFYKENSIPTSDFELFDNVSKIIEAIESNRIKYPFVQKARTGGYDGKGVQVVNGPEDLPLLMQTASVIEDKVDIKKEIAIITGRDMAGNICVFPTVEMVFHPTANLVEYLMSPSMIDPKIIKEAESLAIRLTQNLGITGLLAIEMFLDSEDKILINEVAPRPHNSGHHTIEACYTSQYEQLLRILTELPLGDTSMRCPAVMVNLLGEAGYSGTVIYEGLEKALSIRGVYPHLYGKSITKPFRKMGHITVLGNTPEEAMEKAIAVKEIVKVKSIYNE